MFPKVVCLCGLQWLCLLSVGDLKVHVSSGRISLRTAATKTKRKWKSNISCLCGLQWLCLLSVGDLKVHVSWGRMSLRTAARNTRDNLKAILYVFADCKHAADREDAKSVRRRKMKTSGVVHRGVWERKLGFWLYVIWYACNRNLCAGEFSVLLCSEVDNYPTYSHNITRNRSRSCKWNFCAATFLGQLSAVLSRVKRWFWCMFWSK